MRLYQKINRTFLIAVLLFICAPVFSLQVAAVQWQVSSQRLQSSDQLKDAFNSLLYQHGFKSNQTSLIVFPEYTSVFLMATYLLEKGVLGSLDITELQSYMIRKGLNSYHDLFQFHNLEYRDFALNFWKEFSRDLGCFCLAGTAFIADSSDNMYNRLWLFNPEGDLVYSQNKVYLTPFENEINLTPGRISNASLFSIDGETLGFTICRDTFFSSWEYPLKSTTLWIDIKANGVRYDDDQAENFSRALSARIKNNASGAGLTVCLNGKFDDFIWEGPSSYISFQNGKVIIDKSTGIVNGDIVLVSELKNFKWY